MSRINLSKTGGPLEQARESLRTGLSREGLPLSRQARESDQAMVDAHDEALRNARRANVLNRLNFEKLMRETPENLEKRARVRDLMGIK